MATRLTSPYIPIIAAIVAAVFVTSARPVDARDVLGLWLTKDRDAKVRIANCGGSLCGSIAWLAQPVDRETGRPAADKSNPDPSRRNRPLIGVRIFGMQPAGPDRWSGPIYNADDGKTYSGTIELLGPNALKIQGCLGPFCDYEIWARTN